MVRRWRAALAASTMLVAVPLVASEVVSAADITLTTPVSGTNLTYSNSGTDKITVSTSVTDTATLTLSSGTGSIWLNAGSALSGTTIDLTAAGGGVIQFSAGQITASTKLQSSGGLTGDVNLSGILNNIAAIGNVAVTSGDFILTNNGNTGLLTVSGPLSAKNVTIANTNTGSLRVTGTITATSAVALNYGSVTIDPGALVAAGGGYTQTAGTVTNNGTINGGASVTGGTLTTTGTVSGGLTNAGTVNANGGAINGAIVNNTGGTFNVGGTVTGNSTFNNAAATSVLHILNGGTYTPAGLVTNSGTAISGGIQIDAGGLLNAASGITNNSGATISVDGTLTGVVTNSGTLNIGSGGASGTLSNNITNNGTLNFSRSDAWTYAGVISGTGTMNKLGTGTLTLSGVNTYNGGTGISAGTLLLSGTGTLGATTGALAVSGGVLDLGGTTQTTGALTLTGGTIQNGTLTSSAFGVQVGTISAVLAGSGTLTKTGTGTTTLSGVNTYSGATNVNGGTLSVTGSISSSSLTTVNTGATLTGTGTVGNTTVSGGTFAPGSGAPGSSMTFNGTLGFNSASTYAVQVNPTTSSFSTVSGAATLGGATVNASYAAGSYIAKQYTILTAGSISGTFGTLATTSLPANFSNALSYDATHAYLNLTLNFTQSTSPNYGGGLSGNQNSVGNVLTNYFNSTGGIPTVFGTLTGNGLSQVSGQPGASSKQSGNTAPGQFVNSVFGNAFGGGTGAGGALGFAEAEENAYAPKRSVSREAKEAYAAVTPRDQKMTAFEGRWGVFASVYGGNNRVSGDAAAGTNTTTSRTYGTVVGANYRFTRDTQAGFALGGAGSNFNIDGGFGSGRAEIFNAAVYAKHNVGAAYVAGALTYSWQDTTTDRTVTVSGTDMLRANFKAQALAARLEGGWRYASPVVGVTPYGAVQSTTFFLPSYGETATSGSNQFALSYAAQRSTTTRTELGARFDKAMLVQGGVFTLTNRTAWAHDANLNSSATATFQSLPGSTFTTNGALPSPNAMLASLGAELAWHNGWSVAALLDGEFSRTTRGYTGKATVRHVW